MSEETKAFDEMQNGASANPEPSATAGTTANPQDAKSEELYSRGVQLMQEKKFDQAIKCFDKIPQYKDSKQKSEEAKKIKEETRRATSYDNAIKAFNTGHYDTAIVVFSSLKDYKDSKAKLAICNEKREIARKDAIYDDLMRRVAVESITIAELEKCINEFKTISGHKDADAQVKKLNALVEEKKEQEAIARAKAKKKNKIIAIVSSSVSAALIFAAVFFIVILPYIRYNKAEKLMNQGRYDEALKIYESLDGRDESDKRIAVIEAISSLENDTAASVRKIVSAGVTVNATYNLDSGKRTDTYPSYDNFKNFYTPTKSGYTFDRWELESYTYTVGDWFEVVLNPVFVANTYTVTLEDTRNIGTSSAPTYVYFEGYTASMKVTYGSSYTLPTLDRAEYVLTGWSENGGKDKVESATWNIPYSVTLTPMWEGKEFTVTLDPNGGTVSSTSVNVKYDSTYTLPTPVWAGHTFSGWYNGSQRISTSGTWRNMSDMTLVARWDTDVYNISYNLGGGAVSGSNPDEYTVYDAFTLTAPTKVGYEFIGWTYDGQSEPVMDVTVPAGTIGNKTYTANWTADTYTVTLDLNGGTMSGSTTITVTYDGFYSLPSNVTKVGYTFAGWSKGSSPFDSEGVWQIADDDVTLTAMWTPNTNTPYTVEHYLQNSNGEGYTLHDTDSFTGTTGASVLTYVNTYPHYVSPTAETVIIAADGSTVVKYYYDVATYYIVYVTGGGNAVENQAFRYGQTPTADALPTRAGYTFGGWFIDAELTTPFALTSAPEGNVTAYAWWTEEAKPSDFTFNKSSTSVTINTYTNTTATDVRIPAYIGGVPVTKIAASAFQNKTALKKVVVPDTVTEIGDGAFKGCSSLEDITLPFVGRKASDSNSKYAVFGYIFGRYTSSTSSKPSGTTYQGWGQYSSYSTSGTSGKNYAYSSSYYADYYYIPTSIKKVTITLDTTIPYGAFHNCESIETIALPSTVTTIGNYAFKNCSIKSIDLGSALTTIGNNAFDSCIFLTSVKTPDTVTSIGSYAFNNCISLNRLNSTTDGKFVIPKNVTSIGSYAFYGLETITDLVIPKSVTSIGDYAFYGCTGIKRVNSETDGQLILLDGLKTIGSYAFQNLTKITSIVVPDSVTSIGQYAFSGCSTLESITVPFTGTSATSPSYFYYIFGSSSYVPGTLKNITITGGTTIPNNAFEYLSNVESITIPTKVTSIGSYAFCGCTKLKRLNSTTDGVFNLPESITQIGSQTFYNCDGITKITIPAGVTSIGSYAFQDCGNLAEVKFATECKVETIGEGAFYNCTALTKVEFPASVKAIANSLFYGCTSLEEIEIPDSVTSIGSSAFYGCTSLTTIELPESLTSIKNYAFQNCTSITAIELPETLTSIGSYAFSGCTGIKRINSTTDGEMLLPESLETIDSYAFQNLSQITKVVVPDSVTSIGRYAFRGCSEIESVTVPFIGTSATSPSYFYYIFGSSSYVPGTLKNITITGGTTIPSYAFQSLSKVESITIPSGVTAIGNYAFDGCTKLKRLNSTTDGAFNIPNSVTSIGQYAFRGCSALESITVPFTGYSAESTSSNGYFYYIFGGSSNVPSTLKNITITSDTTISDYAFQSLSNVESITIPSGVTTIGSYAFTGCTNLKRINSTTDGEMILPDGLVAIGGYAFNSLTKITKVVVPDSVTNISEYAFYGCNAIEDITLPFVGNSASAKDSRYAVFGYIFGRYTSSTTSKPSGTTYQGWGQYSSSYPTSGESGRNYSYSSYYYADYYYIPTSIKRVTITVDTTIPYGAFHNCSFIETITVPTTASAGEYAYQNCTATVNKTYVPKNSIWDGSMSTSLSGSGTKEAPYQINSAADLAYLASSVNGGESYKDKYFILNININLGTLSWTPIGTSDKPFAGIFDGNGKKISNLYISTSASTTAYLGLFGNVSGTVKNLGITSGTVTLSSSSATSYVGGLVGYLTGTVENCYSNVSVTATASKTLYVGGLVGYVDSGATVKNSYATGNVSATANSSSAIAYVGGITGYNKGTITGSLAFGNVTAYSSYGDKYCQNGGFTGANTGTLTNCYRSEDQVLTRNGYEDKSACEDGTEASYSDMIDYAEENWDSDVWSFDIKYPTHK